MKPLHIDLDHYEDQLKRAFEENAVRQINEANASGDNSMMALALIMNRSMAAMIPVYKEIVRARNEQLDINIVASAVVSICSQLIANCVVNMDDDQMARHAFISNMVHGVYQQAHAAIESTPAFVTKAVEGGNA